MQKRSPFPLPDHMQKRFWSLVTMLLGWEEGFGRQKGGGVGGVSLHITISFKSVLILMETAIGVLPLRLMSSYFELRSAVV